MDNQIPSMEKPIQPLFTCLYTAGQEVYVIKPSQTKIVTRKIKKIMVERTAKGDTISIKVHGNQRSISSENVFATENEAKNAFMDRLMD